MSDMSDETPRPWWNARDSSYRDIVGLGTYADDGDPVAWPTYGYDGPLRELDWDDDGECGRTGHTRAEWLELADTMIARWQAWRARVAALPPETFKPEGA